MIALACVARARGSYGVLYINNITYCEPGARKPLITHHPSWPNNALKLSGLSPIPLVPLQPRNYGFTAGNNRQDKEFSGQNVCRIACLITFSLDRSSKQSTC